MSRKPITNDKQVAKVIMEGIANDLINEGQVVDSQGQRISTGLLVKKGDKRGKIVGVTSELKVRVEWHAPVEIKGTETQENPENLTVI